MKRRWLSLPSAKACGLMISIRWYTRSSLQILNGIIAHLYVLKGLMVLLQWISSGIYSKWVNSLHTFLNCQLSFAWPCNSWKKALMQIRQFTSDCWWNWDNTIPEHNPGYWIFPKLWEIYVSWTSSTHLCYKAVTGHLPTEHDLTSFMEQNSGETSPEAESLCDARRAVRRNFKRNIWRQVFSSPNGLFQPKNCEPHNSWAGDSTWNCHRCTDCIDSVLCIPSNS